MTDTERERINAICKVAGVTEIDDLSDGFHTFRQLYYQRMMLFATIVKQNKDKAWKSLRHEDGELCFGGGWFIVGIDTPEGSYTYHYEDNYYSLFDCEELERGKHWDGHTEKDVTRLLSLPKAQLSQQSTTSDTISRQAALNSPVTMVSEGLDWIPAYHIKELPSAQPEQLERCPIYDGVCGYPSDQCYDCPRHHGAQPEPQWIPVSERLPENNDPVNVTWVNRNPEVYYMDIKDKPFTATAHYHRGYWYWYSSVTQDYLDEYEEWTPDLVDKDVEIIAWMPLPEAYKPNK